MAAAELLERGRRLVASGPHSPNTSEIAEVHAALYPTRDAVCQTCPGELGRAYYAIQRWVNQQENSSTNSPSNVKKGTTARFHSDSLIYTPHGLGIAYSNANLTDKAARDIIAADPDAAQHFAVLPAEAEESEDATPEANRTQATALAATPSPSPAQPAPVIDYAQLASAILDEQSRRAAQPADTEKPAEAPALTASVGGAADTAEVKKEVLGNGVEVTTGKTDATSEEEPKRPAPLSRMKHDELVATYRAELNLEPVAELTNEQLRDAIAEKRATVQDPE